MLVFESIKDAMAHNEAKNNPPVKNFVFMLLFFSSYGSVAHEIYDLHYTDLYFPIPLLRGEMHFLKP